MKDNQTTNTRPATLVKPTGERIAAQSTPTVEPTPTPTVSSAMQLVRNLIIGGIQIAPATLNVSGSDGAATFTQAAVNKLIKPFTDVDECIKELKKRRKTVREGALQMASDLEKEWFDIVSKFAPVVTVDGKPIPIKGGGKGWKFEIDVEQAVSAACQKVLYLFATDSNMNLLGTVGGKDRNGNPIKPKDSLFNNPKKHAFSSEGSGFTEDRDEQGECDWGVDAALNFMVKHGRGGKNFAKLTSNIALCVQRLDEGNLEEADKLFASLIGRDGTDRFNVSEDFLRKIFALRFAGIYGVRILTAQRAMEELKSNADKFREWKERQAVELASINKLVDQLMPPAPESEPESTVPTTVPTSITPEA